MQEIPNELLRVLEHTISVVISFPQISLTRPGRGSFPALPNRPSKGNWTYRGLDSNLNFAPYLDRIRYTINLNRPVLTNLTPTSGSTLYTHTLATPRP